MLVEGLGNGLVQTGDGVVQNFEHACQGGDQVSGRGDDRRVLGQRPGGFDGGQPFLHFLGPPAVVLVKEGAHGFGLRLLERGQVGPACQEVGRHGRGHTPIQEGFSQRIIGL